MLWVHEQHELNIKIHFEMKKVNVISIKSPIIYINLRSVEQEVQC